MNDLVPVADFDADAMEILPPNSPTCELGETAVCGCCGRRAVMDEDCCGICEECLSP